MKGSQKFWLIIFGAMYMFSWYIICTTPVPKPSEQFADIWFLTVAYNIICSGSIALVGCIEGIPRLNKWLDEKF